MATINGSTASVARARRTELAAFLRARRERIQPEDVGLPSGARDRFGGFQGEAAREHRQLAQYGPFRLGQQVIAPGHRRLEGLLAGHCGPRAPG